MNDEYPKEFQFEHETSKTQTQVPVKSIEQSF